MIVAFLGVCALTAWRGYFMTHREKTVVDDRRGRLRLRAAHPLDVERVVALAARPRVGPLVVLGVFSYSLYLVHAPLLQIYWQYLLVPLGLDHTTIFYSLMTGGLALTIAASYGFFLLFEKPFLGRRAPSLQILPVRSAITQ